MRKPNPLGTHAVLVGMLCARKGQGVPPRARTRLVELLTHPPLGADVSPLVAQGAWGSRATCLKNTVPYLHTHLDRSPEQNAWRIKLAKSPGGWRRLRAIPFCSQAFFSHRMLHQADAHRLKATPLFEAGLAHYSGWDKFKTRL
jgi:hypothetical protein